MILNRTQNEGFFDHLRQFYGLNKRFYQIHLHSLLVKKQFINI
jgi:hypothetical protein